jgi:hypothetical protein
MKTKFVARVLYFIIPFVFICIVNYVVDPFNNNKMLDLGLDKKKISYKLNYRLFDIIEYRNNKVPNILFGDSRLAAIDINEIKKISGEYYYNFAFGSATLPECFDAFWYAVGLTELKRVYFGVPFNMFSKTNSKNIFRQSMKISSQSVDHYLNLFVFKASIYNLIFKVFSINLASETPNMGKEDFWRLLLSESAQLYRSYNWPREYIGEFRKIKEFCNNRKIEMTIIIPPTHRDLQNLINVYHLQKEYAEYKKCLRAIAPVFDYDIHNELTDNKENFRDPYHFNARIMKRLVNEIWGTKTL